MRVNPVLFVDHAPALGGAEHALLMLLPRLDRRQWEPHLACTGGTLARRASELGVPTRATPLPRLQGSVRAPMDLWRGTRSLARLAKEIRAALIVANSVRTAFYVAAAARLTRIPFVWHRHDFWLGESPPRHPWIEATVKRALCGAAASLICNSAATAQRHPCFDKITVVHNGIEIERFDPAISGFPFRKSLGIPRDAPVVGMLGRIHVIKGQDRFLRVLPRILQGAPDVWCIIASGEPFGGDGYASGLRHLAKELKVASRTAFTGHLDDPVPALAAMDVFVQPGSPEGFGLVNVEAMALGKPVAGFSHGALSEIVDHGHTGVLVESANEEALADAIVELLQDPVRRASLGSAGRERAEKLFHIERAATQISAVFREAAG